MSIGKNSYSIDRIAKAESWRKEVFRPPYHIHKWWARRLGSVFRHLILSSFDLNPEVYFYDPPFLKDKIILDPFMGSGTTLGEGLKLGAKVIGNDINPVSYFSVEQLFSNVDIKSVVREFESIFDDVGRDILNSHTIDSDDGIERVIYYLWVQKIVDDYGEQIFLFDHYIISKNAYPKEKPSAKILCKKCWFVFDGRYDDNYAICPECKYEFNPQIGNSKGAYFIDSKGTKRKVISYSSDKHEDDYALFAKISFRGGKKIYSRANNLDREIYREESEKVRDGYVPSLKIEEGHNTNQIISHGFKYWSQLFNSRQKSHLSILLQRISRIADAKIRDTLLLVFSSSLEYNNMLCSYKGEGTGAVRPAFSHHILRPQRIYLEANIWGFAESMGGFSNLFFGKYIDAMEYLDNPFEIKINPLGKAEKLYTGEKVKANIGNSNEFFTVSSNSNVLIFNTDSRRLPIDDLSVDMVITDPPYFDYIHYSELSDLFYSWISLVRFDENFTSRRDGEVQSSDYIDFSNNIKEVFLEIYRVLKDSGRVVFTFHHSKPEGWASLGLAIYRAGFHIEKIEHIYGEMSTGISKSSNSEPVSRDIILFLRKGKRKLNYSLPSAENLETGDKNNLTMAISLIELGDFFDDKTSIMDIVRYIRKQ